MIIVLRLFMMSIILCAIVGAVVAQPKSRGTMRKLSVEQRVKQLHDLLNEQWEYTLRTSPEFASILGDKRSGLKRFPVAYCADRNPKQLTGA
jgi:hypothetical protein